MRARKNPAAPPAAPPAALPVALPVALPSDLMTHILSRLEFNQAAGCARVCWDFFREVVIFLGNVQRLDSSVPVSALECILEHCHRMRRPPDLHGPKKMGLTSMLRMRERWPEHLHLNWDVSSPKAISSLLDYSSSETYRLREIHLKVSGIKTLQLTDLRMSYVDLDVLSIEAEGVDLMQVLTALNCRCWDVKHLYLRGDVHGLAELFMYIPLVSHGITLINCNDALHSGQVYDLNESIRFIANMSLRTVKLSNIYKLCCQPPRTCCVAQDFVHAIRTASHCFRNFSEPPTWTADRMSANMISVLIEHGIRVVCSTFESESHAVEDIRRRSGGMFSVL